MLALSLVLLAIVVLLVVASFVGSSESVVIEFLNATITTSVGGVFVSGFVAGLVALLAFYSAWTSLRRIQHRRTEVRELRRRAGYEDQAPATASDPGDTSQPESAGRRADPEPTRRDTYPVDPDAPPRSDTPRS